MAFKRNREILRDNIFVSYQCSGNKKPRSKVQEKFLFEVEVIASEKSTIEIEESS